MKIYVAFRYSLPSDVINILANIGKAIEAGVEIAKKGHIPYIPHCDCLIAMWSKGMLPKNFYYEMGMTWLKCCDALFLLDKADLLLPNSGVKREYDWAVGNGLRIFYNLDEIPVEVKE